MNTGIYEIDNQKLIGRLLPFFARGRRLFLFMEAVASPLVGLHRSFLSWAYDKIVDVRTTFQTSVFVWYLNYKFHRHFVDSNDSFIISQGQEGDGLIAFNTDEHEMMKVFASRIFNSDEQDMLEDYSKPMVTPQDRSQPDIISILAPKITETSGYSYADYVRGIKTAVGNYRTSFGTINIIIKS